MWIGRSQCSHLDLLQYGGGGACPAAPALPSTQLGKFRISVCLDKQAGRLGHQEEEGGMNLGMEAVEKGP